MKHIALVLLLLAACSGEKRKEGVAGLPAGKGLPDFIMTTLKGDTITTKSLTGSNVLIFYSPDCDHCQREAKSIRSRIEDFGDYTIYFIAASGDVQSEAFAKAYDLDQQPNVIFATAGIPEVIREMGSIGTPTIVIYSAQGKLVRQFDGETPVQDIIDVL